MALNSWGTGVWQAQAVVTLLSPEKCTFCKQRAWQSYKPATPLSSRNLKANYQGFQMIYHLFLYYLNFLIYRLKCKILPRPTPNNMVPSVQRPTIRHLKALVVDNKILGGQGRGSLKGLPCPYFLKSTLFTNSGRGKPLIMPRPCPSRIQMSIIRPFK